MIDRNSIPRTIARMFAEKGRKAWGERFPFDARYRVFAICGTMGGAYDRTYGHVGNIEFCVHESWKRTGSNTFALDSVTVMLCRDHLDEDPSTAVTVKC